MAFDANTTGAAVLDDSVVTEWTQGVELFYNESQSIRTFADQQQFDAVKTWKFPLYPEIPGDVTELVELDDATSYQYSDSSISITPIEQGKVVTKTGLQSFQTGGRVDRALARALGVQMRRSDTLLGLTKLAAGTNIIYCNDRADANAIVAGDIMNTRLAEKAFNALSRNGIGKREMNTYAMLAHTDIISDIREMEGWLSVQKYANADAILNGEVGMWKGFRVFEYPDVPTSANTSSITVYPTICIGFNALGYAESKAANPSLVEGGKLKGRFLHVGWWGIYNYGIVDQNAVRVIKSASSFAA